jgi:hypothetical protein
MLMTALRFWRHAPVRSARTSPRLRVLMSKVVRAPLSEFFAI